MALPIGLAVDRLDESGVDHADPQAVELAQPLGHPQAGPDHRAAGQEHAVGLPLEDLGLAQLDRLDLALDRVEVRPGVSERDGRGVRQGEVEHRGDVLLVARGHDDHVGEDAEIGQVVRAVVGRPVGADQPGAVEAEDDRQVLQGHLLEDLVVGALQERAVDVHDRPAAGLGDAGGEGDRVALADPDVEELVRDRSRGSAGACSPRTWRR